MATKPFYCDECSTRNTPDSKYCKECGSQLHVVYQTLALSDYDRIDDPTEQERLTQLLDMAFWHNEAGNTDAAIRACTAALAINGNSTTAHSLLGCLYEKLGDNEKAIENFEKVLALNPNSEADQAKLEQIQRDVHVKPVRPSPVYRWLPSIFATARFSGWAQNWRERVARVRRPEITLLPPKATPAIAAGCAAILVLAGAMFLIKPAPQGPATIAGAAPATIAHSAFDGSQAPVSAPSRVADLPPPVVMEPERGVYTPRLSPNIAAVGADNPFSRTPPQPLEETPLSQRDLQRETSHGSQSSGLHLRALPRLNSASVPNGDEGPLPPAPVIGPISNEPNAPVSPDSDIARHTVVVHHLNGLSEFGAPDAASPSNDSGQPNEAQGPSRIQITIDPSSSSDSAHGGSSGNGNSAAAASNGEELQQSAFAQQQQGNNREAAGLYQKAISAYQAQIAAGEDRDAAERGLQACQTGLEICRQNS